MRRGLLVLLLLLVPAIVFAQKSHTNDANNVAQGAEKGAHEQTHPNEAHGEGLEAPKKYFGIPGWILKLANMILFFGVLAYFVGGPVKTAFAERSAAIRRAADEARDRREKSDQMASQIQARLSAIESEVRKNFPVIRRIYIEAGCLAPQG